MNIMDQHSDKGIAPQSRSTQKEREAQRINSIPNLSPAKHSLLIILKSVNQSSIAQTNKLVLYI